MTRSLLWGALLSLSACNGDGGGNQQRGTELPAIEPVDLDADSFFSDTDCNDGNAAIFPGATETCNGLDDDCSGGVDDGLMLTYYRDADGDTYGDLDAMASACAQPAGFVTDATDCNDHNRAIHPTATEICDLMGADEDCNGTANEADPGVANLRSWYVDADEDGFGTSKTAESCFEQPGLATVANDCNDADFDINPGTPEVCDALDKDEDCDGFSDVDDPEGPFGQPLYYVDVDQDQDGDMSDPGQYFCDGVPHGYVTLNTDCDDDDDIINPRAPENCRDFIDNDCNGGVDDCGPIADIPTDTSDAIIEGDSSYSYFGWSLNGMGDMNADGQGDLAVGAWEYDSGKGAVYLFEGPVSAGTVAADDIVTAVIEGDVMYGEFGWALDTLGDVNADGFSDMVVGVQSYDNGHAYVFLGPIVGDISASSADATWDAEEYGDYAGKSVAGDFDFDADGTNDYVTGANYADSSASTDVGAVYLVYGPGTGDANLSTADVKFVGTTSYAYFGDAAAGLRDMDGDGADELAIGAWQNSSGSGAVYLFNGGSLGGEISASTADATITGAGTSQYFGRTISRANDFNNDGYGDLVAVAPYARSGYGSAYVILGPTPGGNADTIAQAELYGEYGYGFSTNGGGLDGNGDVNLDGYSDVLVGAPYYSNSGAGLYSVGVGYVMYGPQTGDISLANARCAIVGTTTNDQAGYDMSFVGDQTGDDSPEVLVGGPYASGYLGSAWMVFGDRL
jgi:hypothetical protein